MKTSLLFLTLFAATAVPVFAQEYDADNIDNPILREYIDEEEVEEEAAASNATSGDADEVAAPETEGDSSSVKKATSGTPKNLYIYGGVPYRSFPNPDEPNHQTGVSGIELGAGYQKDFTRAGGMLRLSQGEQVTGGLKVSRLGGYVFSDRKFNLHAGVSGDLEGSTGTERYNANIRVLPSIVMKTNVGKDDEVRLGGVLGFTAGGFKNNRLNPDATEISALTYGYQGALFVDSEYINGVLSGEYHTNLDGDARAKNIYMVDGTVAVPFYRGEDASYEGYLNAQLIGARAPKDMNLAEDAINYGGRSAEYRWDAQLTGGLIVRPGAGKKAKTTK